MPPFTAHRAYPSLMTGTDRHRFAVSRGRILLVSALAVVLVAAAALVVRPTLASVIDCSTRADEVAADVRAAVEGSVGAASTGASVEACEGGHDVSVGLDFEADKYHEISAALTSDGCHSTANLPGSDEFACRWAEDGHDIDIVLIRRTAVTSVVASVDL